MVAYALTPKFHSGKNISFEVLLPFPFFKSHFGGFRGLPNILNIPGINRSYSINLQILAKVFGQLVLLGFDVTAFTPVAYQRRGLRRPSKEISS